MKTLLSSILLLLFSSTVFCDELVVKLYKDRSFKSLDGNVGIYAFNNEYSIYNNNDTKQKEIFEDNVWVKVEGKYRVREDDNSIILRINDYSIIKEQWPVDLIEYKSIKRDEKSAIEINGFTILKGEDKQYYFKGTNVPATYLEFGDNDFILGTTLKYSKSEKVWYEYSPRKMIFFKSEKQLPAPEEKK